VDSAGLPVKLPSFGPVFDSILQYPPKFSHPVDTQGMEDYNISKLNH
jgi:hypothetical protein